MAKASVYLINIDKKIYDKNISPICNHVNVGSGKNLTIKELAETIKEVVGFKGKINFDPTKPDGSQRKFLDSKRINNFGFKPQIGLKNGLIKTYQDYTKA